MNEDTNNLNGTVLGSVDNSVNGIPQPTSNQEIETLDVGTVTNLNVNPIKSNLNQNTVFNDSSVSSVETNNTGVVNENSQVQPLMGENPEPIPNYTNPQYITPNPMPGFENSNTIGTMPPISLQPEKSPNKKGKKVLFILLVLLALLGVGFGTYYILNYTDLVIKKTTITINLKDLEINIGDKLSSNIKDYAEIIGTDSNNCNLNTNLVDVNKEGIYKYTIKCGEITKTGKVTVVDNTELIVNTQKVYKVKGDTLEAKEFVTNVDEMLTYEFVDKELVNTLLQGEKGTYNIKIKASSSNKNVEVDGILVIMDYPVKGYLICSTNEESVSGVKAVMTVSQKFAILNDGNNGFGGITNEIHTFKFNDETEYTNYLAAYKTSNKININNVTGSASFDDSNLTITITNEKDKEAVINEYGEVNMEKYKTIRDYFEDTLKYSCIYKKNE